VEELLAEEADERSRESQRENPARIIINSATEVRSVQQYCGVSYHE
jgi:hypothetical protein